MPTSKGKHKPSAAKQSAKPLAEATYDEALVLGRIREVCGRRTSAEIELLTGMHAETVRRQVRGQVRPSVEFIGRLCGVTGTSAEWMLFGVGERAAHGRSPRRALLKQVG